MNEVEEKDAIDRLYKMKMLEKLAPDMNSTLVRVPGGWVYSDINGCAFVPFDNEFQGKYQNL